MINVEKSWEKTLELLKPELTPVSYDVWMATLKPISWDEDAGKLYLQVYNDYSKSILETRYVNVVESSAKEAFGKPIKVIFVEADDVIPSKEREIMTTKHCIMHRVGNKVLVVWMFLKLIYPLVQKQVIWAIL